MIHLERMRLELARRRLVLSPHEPSANFENTSRPVDEISNETPGDLAAPSGASASGENDLTKGKPDLAGAEIVDTAQSPEDVQSGSIYPDKKTIFTHSVDYRSVCINDTPHQLTRSQATIIRILHEAFQNGTPCVGKDELLAAVKSETSHVKDFFRRSPLWQTLVKSGRRRGTYRLNLSSEE